MVASLIISTVTMVAVGVSPASASTTTTQYSQYDVPFSWAASQTTSGRPHIEGDTLMTQYQIITNGLYSCSLEATAYIDAVGLTDSEKRTLITEVTAALNGAANLATTDGTKDPFSSTGVDLSGTHMALFFKTAVVNGPCHNIHTAYDGTTRKLSSETSQWRGVIAAAAATSAYLALELGMFSLGALYFPTYATSIQYAAIVGCLGGAMYLWVYEGVKQATAKPNIGLTLVAECFASALSTIAFTQAKPYIDAHIAEYLGHASSVADTATINSAEDTVRRVAGGVAAPFGTWGDANEIGIEMVNVRLSI